MTDRRETAVRTEREPERSVHVEQRSSHAGMWIGIVVAVLVLAVIAFIFMRPAADTASSDTDVQIENAAPAPEQAAPPASESAPEVSAPAPAAPPAADTAPPPAGADTGTEAPASEPATPPAPSGSDASQPDAADAPPPPPAPATEPTPAQ